MKISASPFFKLWLIHVHEKGGPVIHPIDHIGASRFEKCEVGLFASDDSANHEKKQKNPIT